MDSQTWIVFRWSAAAVLLTTIIFAGCLILWKWLKSLKNFLFALSSKAKRNQELLNELQLKIMSMQELMQAEMTAYTTVTKAAEAIKTELDSLRGREVPPPEKIMDMILPLNNNDGSAYGFKITLLDGGMLVAVIHSCRKDDLLKDPEISHYHYTLMQYDAKGELLDVRAAPVSEKQEK